MAPAHRFFPTENNARELPAETARDNSENANLDNTLALGTDWASVIVSVKKRDEVLCHHVDYCHLNKFNNKNSCRT